MPADQPDRILGDPAELLLGQMQRAQQLALGARQLLQEAREPLHRVAPRSDSGAAATRRPQPTRRLSPQRQPNKRGPERAALTLGDALGDRLRSSIAVPVSAPDRHARQRAHHCAWCSRRPGRGQSQAISRPLVESVM